MDFYHPPLRLVVDSRTYTDTSGKHQGMSIGINLNRFLHPLITTKHTCHNTVLCIFSTLPFFLTLLRCEFSCQICPCTLSRLSTSLRTVSPASEGFITASSFRTRIRFDILLSVRVHLSDPIEPSLVSPPLLPIAFDAYAFSPSFLTSTYRSPPPFSTKGSTGTDVP